MSDNIKTEITQQQVGFSFHATIPVCVPQNSEKIMAGDYSTLGLAGNADTLESAKENLKEAVEALREYRKLIMGE